MNYFIIAIILNIFNDNIIPNEIKGIKYNFLDLYERIYINDNEMDNNDYKTILEELKNSIIQNKKIIGFSIGQIIFL